MVAIRKESTVILAVFGPQMGVAMLAHVALFVFMIQLLVQVSPRRYFSGVPGVLIRLLTLFSLFSLFPYFVLFFIQLIGHPYESKNIKLQVLEVSSIVICWGTMWSGFFFYSPRPPSQKKALVFLTMAVVLVNVFYILVLLYSMCSQCCKEHEDDNVVHVFNQRASSMKQAIRRRTSSITARIDAEKGKYRNKFKTNTRKSSLFDRVFATRDKSQDSIVVSNPLNAERKLTKKSSKAELMSLSKELRRAKHRAQEELNELQRYELEVKGMVDQAPDEGEYIGVKTRNENDIENTEVEIEMVSRTSRSRSDRLNQMRTHSNEDNEGINPLFLNRMPPAPIRGEGEIKLDGGDGGLIKKNSMEIKAIKTKKKNNRPKMLPSSWMKKNGVSRTKM